MMHRYFKVQLDGCTPGLAPKRGGGGGRGRGGGGEGGERKDGGGGGQEGVHLAYGLAIDSGFIVSFDCSSAVRRHPFILISSTATRRLHNAIQSTMVTASRGDI